jgi:hypothetical protein
MVPFITEKKLTTLDMVMANLNMLTVEFTKGSGSMEQWMVMENSITQVKN